MKAIVNGEVKEIEYITASGEDMAQELIGSYESLELDEDGNRIMTAEQADWWTTEFEKLQEIDELIEDLDLKSDDELYDEYLKIGSCDLEQETDLQLEWLKEHKAQ